MLQVLKLDGKMLELAEQLKGEQSLLVFGRGYNYATALEAALKVGLVTSAMILDDVCRQSVCFRVLAQICKHDLLANAH